MHLLLSIPPDDAVERLRKAAIPLPEWTRVQSRPLGIIGRFEGATFQLRKGAASLGPFTLIANGEIQPNAAGSELRVSFTWGSRPVRTILAVGSLAGLAWFALFLPPVQPLVTFVVVAALAIGWAAPIVLMRLDRRDIENFVAEQFANEVHSGVIAP